MKWEMVTEGAAFYGIARCVRVSPRVNHVLAWFGSGVFRRGVWIVETYR